MNTCQQSNGQEKKPRHTHTRRTGFNAANAAAAAKPVGLSPWQPATGHVTMVFAKTGDGKESGRWAGDKKSKRQRERKRERGTLKQSPQCSALLLLWNKRVKRRERKSQRRVSVWEEVSSSEGFWCTAGTSEITLLFYSISHEELRGFSCFVLFFS